MKPNSLTYKAGAGALKSIRTHGFDISSIGTIAGASGGAKWLVLSQLDRAILDCVVPKLQGPVHLIGTSIGSWRFACYAQNNPIAAIERFESAYIEQTFSDDPDIAEISQKSREIMTLVLGENGAREILDHPLFRTHVMAVRSRNITASENKWLLTIGLVTAATMNLLSRKTLGWFFERALFYDARELPPFFNAGGFPLQKIPLSVTNLADAIVATGAIPLVLSGVRDIENAVPGMYRDGGIIDYHHDLPHSVDGRLTLYPHFYDSMVPGWFDKRLKWRRPDPANVDRTILISPSADFVSRLPNRKIPDRTDFVNFEPSVRMQIWRQCVESCKQMADEFNDVIATDQLAGRLEALN